jgi:2-dehydro-3-deoxyphosphogluconate aldolase / (4S)-4-hydroxy-2-oxoglutarate aldolase
VSKLEGVFPGVGTLITPEQVREAKDAGARFAVSPGFDIEVANACESAGLAYAPGIATPTELMQAQKHPSVAALKLFPAGDLGGAKYLKALKGPFPKAQFIPTGGVNVENAKDYFEAGAIAVGLSAICKGDVIKAENWDKVTQDTKDLLAALQ